MYSTIYFIFLQAKLMAVNTIHAIGKKHVHCSTNTNSIRNLQETWKTKTNNSSSISLKDLWSFLVKMDIF